MWLIGPFVSPCFMVASGPGMLNNWEGEWIKRVIFSRGTKEHVFLPEPSGCEQQMRTVLL